MPLFCSLLSEFATRKVWTGTAYIWAAASASTTGTAGKQGASPKQSEYISPYVIDGVASATGGASHRRSGQ